LARALAGDVRDVSGSISVGDRAEVLRSPHRALRRGLALVSEDRQEEGLFPDLPVRTNISMASLPQLVWSRVVRVIVRRKERQLTAAAAARTGIAPKVLSRHVRVLSGGNQQKSLLARWLMRRCDVLVIIEPTRGVDVGAKLDIYHQLESLARGGAGVLVVSTDVPEFMGLSDRIVVLYKGRVAAVLDPRAVSEQDVLRAMQGGLAEHRAALERAEAR
jgi:ABC-type sugar transport system ATPase subunit